MADDANVSKVIDALVKAFAFARGTRLPTNTVFRRRPLVG